eukprot:CAMPEP_0174300192 /NCGR_PEP_ID=MMETSP0809-20121228/58325_1 /TAXON_ID=73025 ORGANISM="Eutreptiella gymnastica-like, Strain CCMP1594" /NCGR_SAMPLE_ID=MMETSP0809 /ASSEMBLY_ACC=CAM_ASM_000658 /LENGTH=247 /DNA_ID=CAMNT_0015405737 /DNA_START=1393 /DNA_END=2134 /DNA_ORIENTATION=-
MDIRAVVQQIQLPLAQRPRLGSAVSETGTLRPHLQSAALFAGTGKWAAAGERRALANLIFRQHLGERATAVFERRALRNRRGCLHALKVADERLQRCVCLERTALHEGWTLRELLLAHLHDALVRAAVGEGRALRGIQGHSTPFLGTGKWAAAGERRALANLIFRQHLGERATAVFERRALRNRRGCLHALKATDERLQRCVCLERTALHEGWTLCELLLGHLHDALVRAAVGEGRALRGIQGHSTP